MGEDRKGKPVTDKTSREILDGINAAIRDTAALAAAGKLDVVAGMLGPVLPPLPEPATPGGAKSTREILDGIAKALEETRRELAEADNVVRNPGTTGGN
jgi:hypothetical protein